jgi:hypothetical protein
LIIGGVGRSRRSQQYEKGSHVIQRFYQHRRSGILKFS